MNSLWPFAVLVLMGLGCASGASHNATYPGPVDHSPLPQPSPSTGANRSCGDGVCDAGEFYINCPSDCPQRVGVFYSGWHWPAWAALNDLQQTGQPVITVEELLESRAEDGSSAGSGRHFSDLLLSHNLTGKAGNFYYQHMPAGGAYCIVHRRQPGDINYNAAHEGMSGAYSLPDCPNYAQIIKSQAQLMVAAGIDYVVVDATNMAAYDASSDAIQLRPFEVLVQEFAALRAAGIDTPQVAMWQRFPENPIVSTDPNDWSWRHVLNVYNAPAYQNVLMRDAKTGKLVYFYPDLDNFDPNFVSRINANNIIAVPMWAYAQTPRQWSFMSACVQGGHIDDGPCNQPWTSESVIGSQLAVSPTYQTGWASLPWQAAGLLGGLTLRKQFETAFARHPDYLLLSSWNETIAQPGQNGPSMGLETDTTAANVAFVDTYGTEFSRDIEPSQELGTFVYDLVASCLRIYRSGATACTDAQEACCQGGNFSDNFARFDGPGGTFVVYAKPAVGRSALYSCQAGGSPFFSLQADCEGQTLIDRLGWLANRRGGAMLRSLWRCVQPGSAIHAYALSGACPSGTEVEAVLGYVR